MSGDYLWDGAGEVDPEIAKLESALRPLRYRGRPPRVGRRWERWAVGAALLAAVAAATLIWATQDSRPGWSITTASGCPDDDCTLRVGEWVELDEPAKLRVADIGEMTVASGSRIRLEASDARQHRLELARGQISAVVSAPPRLFVVDTPSATAVDLGCAYTLAVDDAGAGRLSVELGWVALEAPAREVVVPAGASARLRAGQGPGVPWFGESGLDAVLHAFETAGGPLGDVLERCDDPRDTLTLVHLLPIVAGDARARVYDRIEGLVPPGFALPPRGEVLALDPAALASLKGALLRLW